MTIKRIKMLQMIALVIAAVSALLCILITVRPDLVGITGLEGNKAVPIAAFVNSVGCIVIGVLYLILLARTRTGKGSKGTVLAVALLLCGLTVIVEPLLGSCESRQVSMLLPEAESSMAMMAMLQTRQGMREFARLLLSVSKAITFLSLGGFWNNSMFAKNGMSAK